jgi:two-component system, response regulator PdtaR
MAKFRQESSPMAQAVTPIRVALAEDVPGTRMAMVRLLKRLGHHVICEASNGAELLEQCAEQEVDVVCTDFDMPVMDGLAAAQELAHKGIPVVLVSGHSDAEAIVLEHEPVVVYITKPVALTSLRFAIERALDCAKHSRRRPK